MERNGSSAREQVERSSHGPGVETEPGGRPLFNWLRHRHDGVLGFFFQTGEFIR